jgi:RNA polymerase sigma-70 factor (sigma-E family)
VGLVPAVIGVEVDRIFLEDLCVFITMGRISLSDTIGVSVRQTGRVELGEFYAEHADSTKRLAFLLTGDKELAEDITQDAFVKMAGRIGGLRNRDASAAYLRQTVVNLSRSHFRRKKVERKHLQREAGLHRVETVEGRDVVVADALWNELQRLAYRQRCAVVLRYYEDLSEHQAADVLGCSVGALKALTNRAMEQLRARVGSEAVT